MELGRDPHGARMGPQLAWQRDTVAAFCQIKELIETPMSEFAKLTLLLVGGGAESAPPVVFLICTENRLR